MSQIALDHDIDRALRDRRRTAAAMRRRHREGLDAPMRGRMFGLPAGLGMFGPGGGGGGGASTWDASVKGSNITLSNGGMDAESASAYQSVLGINGRNSGRHAFEILCVTLSSGNAVIGIADKTNASILVGSYLGASQKEAFGYNANGGRIFRTMTVGNISGTYTTDYTQTHIITVDVDFSSNTVQTYRNGVANAAGPWAITAGKTYYPAVSVQSGTKLRLIATGLTYLPSGATEWG